MNKKTFRTVVITIIIILLIQFVYIKTSSLASLFALTTSLKGFPAQTITSMPTTNHGDFEILEVKTGIKETSKLWFPTVFVKVKNISNEDVNIRHEIKVIYIDIDTNEVINQDDCTISGSTKLFPKDTHKKYQLTSTFNLDIRKEKYKQEMFKRRIQAKLYLDDELINSYPMSNKTIYFEKF